MSGLGLIKLEASFYQKLLYVLRTPSGEGATWDPRLGQLVPISL